MTGYSRRTVRYYVELGLIEPPAGRGRGGFYNDSHLAVLQRIKNLQEKGMGLSSITKALKSEDEAEEVYVRDVWVKYEIMQGLEISVLKNLEEHQRKKISEIIRMAKSIIKEDSGRE